MPLNASDYQTSLGQNPPGTLSNFNPGEYGDTYNIPVVAQQDTVEVTAGDATPGWTATVTNNVTGDSYVLTFAPVDNAGVASAAAADAATTLHNTWNADPRALEFGRMTADSATIVRLSYNDDRVDYTIATVPAGAGATTDTSPDVANAVTQIEVGTFAFRPTNALIAAGADPLSLVTATGAILEQFIGGIVRRGSLQNPSFDSGLTYPVYGPSRNVPVAQRARMEIRTAVDVTVASPPAAVVAAAPGQRVGWLTTGAGLVLTSGVKITRGAKAGGIAQVEFTVA